MTRQPIYWGARGSNNRWKQRHFSIIGGMCPGCPQTLCLWEQGQNSMNLCHVFLDLSLTPLRQSDYELRCRSHNFSFPAKDNCGTTTFHECYIKDHIFDWPNYALNFQTESNCSAEVIILLYCIALYLYIYMALLAVLTNQKRFQCERPREKRAVLRERKEATGSPVNEVDRIEGRRWFQSEGPMIAKACVMILWSM